MALSTLIIHCVGFLGFIQIVVSSLPVRIPVAGKGGINRNGICSTINNELNIIKVHIRSAIKTINDELNNRYGPPCLCGYSEGWTRMAYLNMTDSSEQCPSNWSLHTSPVRGCGRSSSAVQTCYSTIYGSSNMVYSKVCGRILGYQAGSPDAFYNYITGGSTNINGAYMDGISLTHGPANFRQHIWSFVGSFYFQDANYEKQWNCRCANTLYSWPYQIPPFIGNNYFCDAAYGTAEDPYTNPLWDGYGCPATSTCCKLNNPPWFCTTLPQPTSDDLEVRLCLDQMTSNENILISLIEIYVQ